MSKAILTKEQAFARLLNNKLVSTLAKVRRGVQDDDIDDEEDNTSYEFVRSIDTDGTSRLYIFSNGERSIILPSDEYFPAIIGVTEEDLSGEIPEDSALSWILNTQARNIALYQEKGDTLPAAIKAPTSTAAPKEKIDPLLYGICHGWGLRIGYDSTPEYKNGGYYMKHDAPNGKWEEAPYTMAFYDLVSKQNHGVPCGCNTLAISQLIAYWGSRGYFIGCNETEEYISEEVNSNGDHFKYKVAKLPNIHKFNYESLLLSAYSGDNIPAAAAAARLELFQQVSRSIYSTYSPTGTSGFTDLDRFIIKNNLGLSKNPLLISVNNEEGLNLIYQELAAGRPVLMTGTNLDDNGRKIGGHCYICDGYKPSMSLTINGVKQTVTGNFFHICTGSETIAAPKPGDSSGDTYYYWGSGWAGRKTDPYKSNSWYILTSGTGTRYSYSEDNTRAIINVLPILDEMVGDIKGDLNNDGFINMNDVTEAILALIDRKNGMTSRFEKRGNYAGLKITGSNSNSLFLPYGGVINHSNDLYPSYQSLMGCYINTSSSGGTIYVYNIVGEHDISSGDGLSNDTNTKLGSRKANARLVYIGATPEADGAVDLGTYLPQKKGEPKHILWAPKNVGAENPEDPGVYLNQTLALNNLGDYVNTRLWRLPTTAELHLLVRNTIPYSAIAKYDLNGDGSFDINDVLWLLDSILGKLVRLFHSTTMRSNEININSISSTNELKNFVSNNTYYGGYYETAYSSKLPEFTPVDYPYPSLLPYSEETAATTSINVRSIQLYYLHEVSKYSTIPIILGSDFMAIPWEGPLSRAYLGEIPAEQANIVADYLGETVDSFTITKNGETETITKSNGNYILFPSGITKSQITSNGITIETLDGVQVLLEFGEDDFNTQYQTWALDS